MKILWVIDNLGSGGAQRQMVTLAKMLKEKNFDVSVVCYAKGDFFAEVLAKDDIPVYWKIENNYLKRVYAVRRFIRKGDFDAVISFMDVPNFLNCVAAIGGKKWKVITNELSAKQSTFRSRQGKIFAWFQQYSDALICNSHNAKNMWLKYYPQYKNELGVIYNPVVLPEIKSTYIPKKDGKLNMVIAASYQYLKNPIGLIKALSLMNVREKEQIKINWFGEKNVSGGGTKCYEEAQQLIDKHNLHKVISLNGPTRDIAKKMYEADMVALLSSVEGLPNAVLEGMLIGKPIIMSRVSDYPVLVDETNGFLCDWDNPEFIKNTLAAAINLSSEQLNIMGEKSKNKAKHLFSSEVIVQQWMNVIEND
jgi:glycosyltransferase involved in cell wall biosynthesis